MPDITSLAEEHPPDPGPTTATEVDELYGQASPKAAADPSEILEIDDGKEAITEVSHIKCEAYLKDRNFMIVRSPSIKFEAGSLSLIYADKSFIFMCKTNDPLFFDFKYQPGKPVLVRWTAKLSRAIAPEKCSHRIISTGSGSRVEITLAIALPSSPWSPGDVFEVAKGPSIFRQKGEQISAKDESSRPGLLPLKPLPSPSSDAGLSLSSEKPTCAVKPYSQSGISVPLGYTGLRNLGNTCFLNSVLQVLFNTTELKEYFLNGYYVSEINQVNPLGMQGQLATTFAKLFAQMWNGMNQAYEPANLKKVVASKAHQFANFAQHDSQEFLCFLLDGLHEDLNRVQRKPLTKLIESDGRPDAVVAKEAWDTVRLRDDSLIVDLFYGQYKSKLHCPNCGRYSITFDPFLYLAAPFPRTRRSYTVFYWGPCATSKPVKYVLNIRDGETIRELANALSPLVGIRAELIQFVDVFERKIYAVHPHTDIANATIKSTDLTFAFGLLDEKEAGEPIVNLVVSQTRLVPERAVYPSNCPNCHKQMPAPALAVFCPRCEAVAYCSQACLESQASMHRSSVQCSLKLDSHSCTFEGLPFHISIPKSKLTYARLEEAVEQRSRWSVDIFMYPQNELDLGTCVDEGDEKGEASVMEVDENVPPAPPPPPEPTVTVVQPKNVVGAPKADPANPEDPTPMDTEVSPDGPGPSTSSGPPSSSVTPAVNPPKKKVQPTRLVMGETHSPRPTVPLFRLRLCPTEDGRLTSRQKTKLVDDAKPDDLIDATGHQLLLVEWRTKRQLQNYLSVRPVSSGITVAGSDKNLVYEDAPSKTPTSTTETRRLHLNDLLENFCQEETLTAQEAWYCDKCKAHQEASKKLSLWRLPPLLVVQLKRFQYSALGSTRSKIDKTVEYPLRDFDLSQFMASGAPKDQCTKYDLYGVVNHMGSSYFGHYTSYGRLCDMDDSTKTQLEWRLFDDSHVSKVHSDTNVVNPNAYLLFYKRRDQEASRILKGYRERNAGKVPPPETSPDDAAQNGGLPDDGPSTSYVS